jgi:ethanolamine utilization microcompartment shell protein EutS
MKQTAVEQAKELVNKYYVELKEHKGYYDLETAKQCALIAVDLAIQYNDFHIEFLQEVKQEIENF